MILVSINRRLSRLLGRFARDKRGVSAVEFAMLLPLMLTLYLGATEISQGVGISRKVTLVARSLSDLVAQTTSINNAEMTNVLNAAASVVAPYNSSPLKVTVSSVVIDAQGNAKVAWSDTKNGTARAVGESVTLPTALKVPNSSLIWAESQYAYTPPIGYVITGAMTLKDQIFMRPRQSDTVTRTAS